MRQPQEKNKEKGGPGFGHIHLAGELSSFLDERLANPPRAIEPSPVIGVFGEWGSGKSSLLHEIHRHFQERVNAFNPREPASRLVLPVWFNPWRYEKEEHLFIPLLKTLELELEKFVGKNRVEEEAFAGTVMEKAGKAAKTCAIAALSFASMFKLKLGVPGLADVTADPEAAIKQAKALLDSSKKENEELKAIHTLSSHYFEFVEELKKITQAREAEPSLNLLFLIDDLDRCLPEKAVEMLEAIKLFLDVPGCGFAVAVDDAVVERGIQHRYRDYRNDNTAEAGSANHDSEPISGGEYLEKIIHLPVRLPRPTDLEVEQFLKSFDLFRDRSVRRSTGPESGKEEKTPPRDEAEDATPRYREDLLKIFVKSIPPVPRKLIRAVELFGLMERLAKRRGWNDYDPHTLARVVLLQLFAPRVYRFARKYHNGLFVFLHELMEKRPEDFERKEYRTLLTEMQIGPLIIERMHAPLLQRIHEARNDRSGFDPFSLVKYGPPPDKRYGSPYFCLVDDSHVMEEPAAGEIREYWKPEDQEQFLTLLLDDSESSWLSALDYSDRRNRWLDETAATVLIRRIVNEDLALPFQQAWLERVAAALSPDSLKQLYRETRLLHKLGERRSVGEDGRALRLALELICRKVNPPQLPGTLTLTLEELDAAGLDLGGLDLRFAYLRGFDLRKAVFEPDREPDLRYAYLQQVQWPGELSSHSLDGSRTENHLPALRPFVTPLGHSGSVNAFAPLPDGSGLVSASGDRTLRIWRPDGKGEWRAVQTLTGHDHGVGAVASLPDGSGLVSASDDGTLRIWRPDGKGEWRAAQILTGHGGGVRAVAPLPDGSGLVSASDDGNLRIWRPDGKGDWRYEQTLTSHEGGVRAIAPLPDGSGLVSAWDDGTLRIWCPDGKGGWRTEQTVTGHEDVVMAVAPLPDGSGLVSASYDCTLRIWRPDGKGDWLAEQTLAGHEDPVLAVAPLPDGSGLVSASYDGTLRIWRPDRKGDWRTEQTLTGHGGGAQAVAPLPDGSGLVSASGDRILRIWRLDGKGDWSAVQTPMGHEEGGVRAVVPLPDGGGLVSASGDRTLRIWRSDGKGDWRAAQTLRGHEGGVWAVAPLPDGSGLVSASSDRTLRIWRPDAKGNWSAAQTLTGHEALVWAIAPLPDGSGLVSASGDRTLRIWRPDAKGDWSAGETLRGHDDGVWAVALLPDGGGLVSASGDRTLRIWRPDGKGDWRAEQTLRGHDDVVWAVAPLPDGGGLVSASGDRTLRIWRPDGKGDWRAEQILRGHDHGVGAVAPLPDGKGLVSASYDCTLRIWRPDGKGEWSAEQTLTGHEGWVQALAPLPDGSGLVSGGDDGMGIWRRTAGGYEMEALISVKEGVVRARLGDAGYSLRPADPDRIWNTQRSNGRLLPADSLLYGQSGFVTEDGVIRPAYEFPELLEWDDEENPRVLRLHMPGWRKGD